VDTKTLARPPANFIGIERVNRALGGAGSAEFLLNMVV
jgi:hypothetical protein